MLTTGSDQGLIPISSYPLQEKHQGPRACWMGSMSRMGSSRLDRAIHGHCCLSSRHCGTNNIRLQGRVLFFQSISKQGDMLYEHIALNQYIRNCRGRLLQLEDVD
jgi:hypothetical protein